MQELQSLEIFEIEVLELMSNARMMESLYFGGGTMLRLCHNLNRYSTDLDFWLNNKKDSKQFFSSLKNLLESNYTVTDAENKKNTLLFEIKTPSLKRCLKIEIRKEQTDFEWERKIAFSSFTNKQVLVKALTLSQMMKNKVKALLSRKAIRDCFDIEFLLMRGIPLPKEKKKLEAMLRVIDSYKERDFKVTLGSILSVNDRKLYVERRFALLKEEITSKIALLS
jgi:hypothetical protein